MEGEALTLSIWTSARLSQYALVSLLVRHKKCMKWVGFTVSCSQTRTKHKRTRTHTHECFRCFFLSQYASGFAWMFSLWIWTSAICSGQFAVKYQKKKKAHDAGSFFSVCISVCLQTRICKLKRKHTHTHECFCCWTSARLSQYAMVSINIFCCRSGNWCACFNMLW